MAVYVQIPENPNCREMDGQVFQCRTAARIVTQVRMGDDGSDEWCAITGIDEAGHPCAATACIIEDSGEGECYLVVGGGWGLRFNGTATWARHVGRPSKDLGSSGAGAGFLILGPATAAAICELASNPSATVTNGSGTAVRPQYQILTGATCTFRRGGSVC